MRLKNKSFTIANFYIPKTIGLGKSILRNDYASDLFGTVCSKLLGLEFVTHVENCLRFWTSTRFSKSL